MIKCIGEISIIKNGEVILERRNNITGNFRSHVIDSLKGSYKPAMINGLYSFDEHIVGWLPLTPFFTAICFTDSITSNKLTLSTSEVTSSSSYGRKFKGNLNSSRNYNITDLHLIGIVNAFPEANDTTWANANLNAPIPIEPTDTLEVLWDIYFTASSNDTDITINNEFLELFGSIFLSGLNKSLGPYFSKSQSLMENVTDQNRRNGILFNVSNGGLLYFLIGQTIVMNSGSESIRLRIVFNSPTTSSSTIRGLSFITNFQQYFDSSGQYGISYSDTLFWGNKDIPLSLGQSFVVDLNIGFNL